MSATPEIVLVREKARRLGNGELADEILRCRRGMQAAANRSSAARFERRLHVMQEEADRRMAAGGAA